jgi:cbb3-type cytochrome oxidase maturation protein
MEIVYFLVPFSVMLGLLIIALLAWSVGSGQFEELDVEGQRILDESC